MLRGLSPTGTRRYRVVTAYVLIEMSAGHSRGLVEKLKDDPGVREASRVTGPYDVLAVIVGEDLNAISNTVAASIHPVQGVLRTTTCIGIQ